MSSKGVSMRLLQAVRYMHTSRALFAEEAVATPVVSKLSKDQLKKRELRRLLKSKADARKPAAQHTLYMPISQALRYLRAAEVGQPVNQQTVTLTTLIVADKGVPPLFGAITLPTPLKEVKIAAFSNNPEVLSQVKKVHNCHLVGGTELIEKIKSGEVTIDFHKAYATPDIAPMLMSQLGRILGPKGLLPNVKKGTVSEDLMALISNDVGTMPFRQRGDSVSLGIGKIGFSDKQMLENIIATREAFRKSISEQKSKKNSILGKTTLSSTHGPGIVIDFA